MCVNALHAVITLECPPFQLHLALVRPFLLTSSFFIYHASLFVLCSIPTLAFFLLFRRYLIFFYSVFAHRVKHALQVPVQACVMDRISAQRSLPLAKLLEKARQAPDPDFFALLFHLLYEQQASITFICFTA